MWVQVDRPNKRPMHAKLNGMVLRWDDPFWDTCYPPNGFGCECHIRALTKAEVKDMGLKVISGDAISFTPDPSWDYNPGKEFYYPDLNKYDYDVAKQWVKGGLTGKDFKGFMDQEVNGNFPVAVLDQEYQDLIGAKTKVVNFSDESRDKNITNHPELTINDYINLPTSISDANVIIQKGDQNLIFIKKDNKIYFSVIKSTESGDELYLTSFRLSNEKDMKNEMGKGSVIKNDL